MWTDNADSSIATAALSSSRPFADDAYIISRVLSFYTRGLEALAEDLPEAGALLEDLSGRDGQTRYRTLGGPVIRSAVNRALQAYVDDRSYSEDVSTILRYARESVTGENSPLGRAVRPTERLRLGLDPVWVWCEPARENVLTQSFRALFKEEISDSIASEPTVLRSPSDPMVDALHGGIRILRSLVPILGNSVLSHVQVVAVVDVADQSKWARAVRPTMCQNVSTHTIPGTIFLSPSPLRTPWHAAEALFHEALHKKLSDVVLTFDVFRDQYDTEESETIHAVWNRDLTWNSNRWPVDRALFAYHFYVYIAYFYRCIQERMDSVPDDVGALHVRNPAAVEHTARLKAAYLRDALLNDGEPELGTQGRALVQWLSETQENLFGTEVGASELSLWLHRYEKETAEVGRLLDQIPESARPDGDAVNAPYEDWSPTRLADHLVHSEVVSAYRILSILGEKEIPSFPFYDGDRWSLRAQSSTSSAVRAQTFRSIRTFVLATLRSAASEDFERICHTRRRKTLRSIVVDTVQHAGRHVEHLRLALDRERKVI